MIAAGEAGHVAGSTDHGSGHDRADAEDAGQGAARGAHCHGELLLRIKQLGIGAAQVTGKLSGELTASCLHGPCRGYGVQQASGMACGDLFGYAAGYQLAQHRVQPAHDLGAGAAQIAVAPGATSSAPPRDHQGGLTPHR